MKTRDEDLNAAILQVASIRDAIVRWGYITSTGTVSSPGSGDWTCARGGIGNYTITWPVPFKTELPTVIGAPTANGFFRVSNPQFANCQVQVIGTGFTAIDSNFFFVAIGGR